MRYAAVLILVGTVALGGCTKDYVTGGYSFNLYNEDQEVAMGRQADPAIVAQYGLYGSEELSAYIDQLGQDVARTSQRPQLEYTFRVLDSPVINAFALPGGWVYMTRGILAHFNSEDELVGVLGHEVGHVVARHGVEQMSRSALAGAGVQLLQSVNVPVLSDVAGTSVALMFLKFSRSQESESDGLGVEYSTRLGYDAHRMAAFFTTLQRQSEASGGSGLPGFLSTHPDPGDREAEVNRLTDQWQTQVKYKPKNTNPNDYLKRIDGIVYGDDPRQGFVENGVFYHPQLRFQFPVPEDWNIHNSPSVVQMMDPEEKALVSFSFSGERSAAAAADSFLARSGAKKLKRESTRVHGVPAVVLESSASNRDLEVRILSYFIVLEGKVYAFHGFTYAASWGSYVAGFRAIMTGFQRLTSARIIAVKPERIRLQQAPRAGDFESILRDLGYGDKRLSELALLNGRNLTDLVDKGDWLKTVGK